MADQRGAVDVARLRELAAGGAVDDVIVAVPDLAGRLQGSRVAVEHFLADTLDGGFAACAYLVASDVEMVTSDRYAFSPWGGGFRDFVLRPDPHTIRLLPWDPRAAIVITDAEWPTGDAVDVAPRRILGRQLDRLTERGLHALAATELELRVFDEAPSAAAAAGYAGLQPATTVNSDYALSGLGTLERLGRELRSTMRELGVAFETARGECAPGQYEVTFRYGPALETADNHALYKLAARAVAERLGVSLTFMAKYDGHEGSSGHVHFSLRDGDGRPAFAGNELGDRAGMSPLMSHFLAGQLTCLPELLLLFAPTLNSYKRLRPGAFAPTGVAWGRDNRTCPLRVVGSGEGLRFEHRVPGADVNPYLALAAIVAAGLHGIDERLPLEAATSGNAFGQDRPSLPGSLEEAARRWERSEVAARSFGPDVVTHLAAAARAELDAFATQVTDWERARGFARH